MKQVDKILIVDDDRASMYLVQMLLEDLKIGAGIATVTNGKEALDYMDTHCVATQDYDKQPSVTFCPELILLDINMPVMDGFEFLDACQQKECFKGHRVKVVMISSSSAAKDIQKAKTYGVTDYLVKPITEEQLLGLMS